MRYAMGRVCTTLSVRKVWTIATVVEVECLILPQVGLLRSRFQTKRNTSLCLIRDQSTALIQSILTLPACLTLSCGFPEHVEKNGGSCLAAGRRGPPGDDMLYLWTCVYQAV